MALYEIDYQEADPEYRWKHMAVLDCKTNIILIIFCLRLKIRTIKGRHD